MLSTTLGQLLVNDKLPQELRDYSRTLDKKSVDKLLQEVATRYPEKYKEIAKAFMDMGHEVAYFSGSQSFGLKHMLGTLNGNKLRDKLKVDLNKILDSDLSEEEKEKRVLLVTGKSQQPITDAIYKDSIDSKSPLGEQVLSGTRGSPSNLKSLLAGDGLYVDYRDKLIPIPVLKSYSEGLSPAEYYAGTFGARKGVVDVKMSTADAGYFGKQLNQLSHRLLVTANDADDPKSLHDRGLPVETMDSDNEGALLAKAIGPFKRDTILTPAILNHIKDAGHDKILVRSPIVSGSPEGGIYAYDAGVREKGDIAPLADNVGMAAAQALGEPTSQLQLCLAKGTLVRMADWSIKKIEEIRIGDMVLGSDLFGNTAPVKVTATYNNGIKPCDKTVFIDSRTIISTCDHKILLLIFNDSFEPIAGQIRPIRPITFKADAIFAVLAAGIDQRSNIESAKLISQEYIGEIDTFDIEVDNADHLFVLANGLIVSNSSKHTGGVAGASKGVSGFKYINQLVQVPKHFKGGAAHAQVDGKVDSIEEAPAGGYYVTIGGQQHYVGAGFDLKVKRGDEVEAGDILSEGIPNPAEIVQHKGIGEGRRYFMNAFRGAYKDSGITAHRRNIELLARGLINHVKLDDEMESHVPGDIVPYSYIEHIYKPRHDHEKLEVNRAKDKYLEKPVLHYSIGTKLRPSVINELKQFGVTHVLAHKDPPPFQPEMVRAMQNLTHDPDWMTKMLGSNLQRGLLGSAHRGAVSNELGTSYVPGMARSVDFGRKGMVRDWHEAAKEFKDKIIP